MLSDRQIRAYNKVGMISDGGGLYLRLSSTGSKTFLYRTRAGGVARYVTLGTYPDLELKEARRKAERLQGTRFTTVTVEEATEAYLSYLDFLHPKQVRQRLYKDIVSTLGNRRIQNITSTDLALALQGIVDRGSPISANRTLADVKHLFTYAFEMGFIQENPADRITRKVIGGREKTRDIVLSDSELQELIAELRKDRWEPKTRAGLAICLLTGQRASEVLGIQGEVKANWWMIPKDRTKAKRAHAVYLVPLARRLSQYVEPCDHRTLSRALNRAGYRFTPHDLRRTMSTRLADLGVMPHVIEKMLNHQMEGVMAVYNRAAYLPEREAAWKLWYSYLRRLTLPTP